jgi:hypothetical protein
MSGPAPSFRPEFPVEFLDECRRAVRLRSVARGEFQRARLALLLHGDATLSNVEAGAAVELHPNSVRLWRRRWADGDFSLIDQEGRGRKAGPNERIWSVVIRNSLQASVNKGVTEYHKRQLRRK